MRHPPESSSRQQAAPHSSAILIVEDEVLIALLMEDILVGAGFGVKTTYCGRDAVGVLDRKDAAYACLVTDIDMPHQVDGWQVARHARERWPAIPVVYVTGAGAYDWKAKGVARSVLVQKPFVPEELVSSIRTLTQEDRARAVYRA